MAYFTTAGTDIDTSSADLSFVSTLQGAPNPSQVLLTGAAGSMTLRGSFSAWNARGLPTAGTITSIDLVSGAEHQTLSSLSLSAATFNSLVAANNGAGFWAAVTAGADTMVGAQFGDWMDGGADNDVLFGNGGADTLWGGAGANTLVGGADGDLMGGGEGADQIWGGDGNDTIAGGAGANQLSGQDGDDLIFGGAGNDAMYGGAGNDSLQGFDGSDVLSGEAGNDTLAGGAGTDFLFGGDGVDVLIGGAGDDLLSGGAGGDRFVVGANTGVDWITDFNSAQGDKVMLQTGTTYTIAYFTNLAVVTTSAGATVALEGVTSATLGDWVGFY